MGAAENSLPCAASAAKMETAPVRGLGRETLFLCWIRGTRFRFVIIGSGRWDSIPGENATAP